VSRRIIGNVLKYLLALGLMTYVLWSNWKPESPQGLAAVWQRHVVRGEPLHTGYLALAFLAGLAGNLLGFLRWYFLVRAVRLPFRVRDALRLGFIGSFFNTFLPGSVGGDLIKAASLARTQDRRTVAIATVVMDRVLALWALVGLVALLGAGFWLAGVLHGTGVRPCLVIVGAAWAVVVGSTLAWTLLGLLSGRRAERLAGRLSRLPTVGHSAAEFWRAVWMYRCRSRSVLGALALSWVGHTLYVLVFYFSVLTLGGAGSCPEIPTLPQHFLIVPVGLVIQIVPLFPGGAGIGELGFGKLYEWLGCSRATGVLGSLAQRVVTWGLGLLGYVVYLRMPAVPRAAEPAVAEVRSPIPASGCTSEAYFTAGRR
jgi:uncharacterized protein (TIRG00374 family)